MLREYYKRLWNHWQVHSFFHWLIDWLIDKADFSLSISFYPPGEKALQLDQQLALGRIAEEGEEDPRVDDEVAELKAQLAQVGRDGRQVLQLDLAQHAGMKKKEKNYVIIEHWDDKRVTGRSTRTLGPA